MSSSKQGQILDLVGKVYDAALDPALWGGVASHVAGVLDTVSTALQVRDTRTGAVDMISITEDFTPAMISRLLYVFERVAQPILNNHAITNSADEGAGQQKLGAPPSPMPCCRLK